MTKIIPFVLLCFILINTAGQAQGKITTYLTAQYNKTISDRSLGNNPWGAGLGFQAFLNNSSTFKPTMEVTGDLYLEDDKVFRTNSDRTEIIDVNEMINVFVGASFNPTPGIYLSFVAGPSFINHQQLLGIKPSFGFYFSKYKRWTGKLSYINIFNRDKKTKDDFGSIGFAVGVRLF